MPDRHRLPATTLRLEPKLKARAVEATKQLGSDLTAHVTGFLSWLVGETDSLPARPGSVSPEVAHDADLLALVRGELAAVQAIARERGDDVAEVLRCLLSSYQCGGFEVQYRARSTEPDGGIDVENIAGDYRAVRRMFPPKCWDLDERVVFAYRAARPHAGTADDKGAAAGEEPDGR